MIMMIIINCLNKILVLVSLRVRFIPIQISGYIILSYFNFIEFNEYNSLTSKNVPKQNIFIVLCF